MKTEKEPEAFLERMRERLSDKPEASHTGKHRAAFTALRPLIEIALAHGYTMKATWEGLRDERKLSMSYQAFRMYCREAGVGRPPQSAPLPSQPRPEPIRPAGSTAASSSAADSTDGTQRAFRHERVPRKGDIYG
jgi:hypothetical protein